MKTTKRLVLYEVPKFRVRCISGHKWLKIVVDFNLLRLWRPAVFNLSHRLEFSVLHVFYNLRRKLLSTLPGAEKISSVVQWEMFPVACPAKLQCTVFNRYEACSSRRCLGSFIILMTLFMWRWPFYNLVPRVLSLSPSRMENFGNEVDHIARCSFSYPETSGSLASGWSPGETLGNWNFI